MTKLNAVPPEINQDLNSHIEILLDNAQKSTHSNLIDALLATVTTLNQGMAIAKKVTLMNITIIGGGYVGLVSAVCFKDLGHTVTCIEHDPIKCTALKQQNVPFYEPQLSEKLAHVMANDKLKIHDTMTSAMFESDVIMLAVGTPMAESGEANCDDLFNAVSTIIALGKDHAGLPIILTTKSTVPVGTDVASRPWFMMLTYRPPFEWHPILNFYGRVRGA